MPALRCRDR